MGNFGIKIDLLKLKNSFVTNLKGKAATKRCLVIPYRRQRSLPRRERGVSEPHSR